MTAVSSAAAVAGLSAAASIAVEALKATLAAEQAVIQRLIAPSVESGRGQLIDMLA
ncbi:MAG: hypothetical protein SF002_18390 [Alphaproteobacteria bacterium]|nr:hypothetical protein [Alphaproteobacteria bacterium]